jgi:hypothetical protein
VSLTKHGATGHNDFVYCFTVHTDGSVLNHHTGLLSPPRATTILPKNLPEPTAPEPRRRGT